MIHWVALVPAFVVGFALATCLALYFYTRPQDRP